MFSAWFTNYPRKTAFDNVTCDKTFIFLKIQKINSYQGRLTSLVCQLFDKSARNKVTPI